MLIELIMMSNFGRADGGRETWAYGFLPELLERDPSLELTIFGFRKEGQRDNTAEMMKELSEDARRRLTTRFLAVKPTRLPLFFSMAGALFREPASDPVADYTIGVGGLFELLLIRFFRRGKRNRTIIWLRGIFVDEKADRIPRIFRSVARRIEAAFLRRVDLLLANGDDIAAHYKRFGLSPKVIKNGVDARKWHSPPPGLESPIRVAFIGRLAKVKGIEEFCALAEQVKGGQSRDSFEFVVIGDGPYRPQVERLKKNEIVSYEGAVPNERLPELLSQTDVCVALTFSSSDGGGGGTSNALLEQMAAGRVILAWDNPHFRQLVDRDSAYLVEQGDVNGLAAALNEITSDRQAALSRADRAVSEAGNYRIAAQVERFEDALRSVALKSPLPVGRRQDHAE